VFVYRDDSFCRKCFLVYDNIISIRRTRSTTKLREIRENVVNVVGATSGENFRVLTAAVALYRAGSM